MDTQTYYVFTYHSITTNTNLIRLSQLFYFLQRFDVKSLKILQKIAINCYSIFESHFSVLITKFQYYSLIV